MSYLYLPFVLQGILMGVDEYFHHRRELGLWERLGHPLDTLTVFVPLSYIAIHDYSKDRLVVVTLLALFSCIFITKDEFIHSEVCGKWENWIHSLLFILHPMIFVCAVLMWRDHPLDEFLLLQPLVVGIFMIYQIIRWSIPWKKLA